MEKTGPKNVELHCEVTKYFNVDLQVCRMYLKYSSDQCLLSTDVIDALYVCISVVPIILKHIDNSFNYDKGNQSHE